MRLEQTPETLADEVLVLGEHESDRHGAEDTAVTHPPPSARSGGPGTSRPLVLIVDDNERNLKLARDVLRAAGLRTIEAASGGEGHRSRGRAPAGRDPAGPAAPGHGRHGCPRKLRDGARTARIPVVALSALPSKARAIGCSPPVSRAISRSRSASASFRTRCAAIAHAHVLRRRSACRWASARRACQHPVAIQVCRVVTASTSCRCVRWRGGRFRWRGSGWSSRRRALASHSRSAAPSSWQLFSPPASGSDDDSSAAQDIPRVGLMHVGLDHVPRPSTG